MADADVPAVLAVSMQQVAELQMHMIRLQQQVDRPSFYQKILQGIGGALTFIVQGNRADAERHAATCDRRYHPTK